MTANTWEHDIKDVAMTIGDREVTGLAAGQDSISFEFDEDAITMKAGARGDVQVSSNHARMGTITLKLLSGNPLNGYLYTLFKSQDTRLRSFPVAIKNLRTGMKLTIPKAYILKEAPIQLGNEAQDAIEWQLKYPFGRVNWADELARLFAP